MQSKLGSKANVHPPGISLRLKCFHLIANMGQISKAIFTIFRYIE